MNFGVPHADGERWVRPGLRRPCRPSRARRTPLGHGAVRRPPLPADPLRTHHSPSEFWQP